MDCHKSTNPKVTAAITANDTRCVACHEGTHPHRSATVTDTVANGERTCGSCHSMDLVTEHGKPTSSSAADPCGACHGAPGGDGGPRAAIGNWDGTCSQSACHGPGTPRAVHDDYCMACHATGQPDFALRSEVDFDASTVDRAKCRNCHWKTDHYSHGMTGQCNSCHYAMPARTDFYRPVVTTATGSFTTSASAGADAAWAHSVHLRGSWPASVTAGPTDGQPTDCASCHSAAACTACHTAPAHGSHAGSASSTYPPETYRATEGKPLGTTTRDTSSLQPVTCTTPACHPRAATGATLTRTTTEQDAAYVFTPAWSLRTLTFTSGGTSRSSTRVGATAVATVSGPGRFEVIGTRTAFGGIATVSVDGGAPLEIDTYSNDTEWQASLFSTGDLPAGQHTIRVTVLGRSRAGALGTRIELDALRATRASASSTPFVPKCSSCHPGRVSTHW